jgi:hypothetical protein
MINDDVLPSRVITFFERCTTLVSLMNLGFVKYDLIRVPSTKVVSESFELVFRNSNGVSMKINFSHNDLGIVLVYIFNSLNKEPLNFEMWLKKHHKLPSHNSFVVDRYEGVDEMRLDQFFEFLERAFNDSEFCKILSGEAWEHIPFSFRD